MRKKILAVFGAATLLFMAPAAASADEAEPHQFTNHITGAPDNDDPATDACDAWATDDFTRTTTITENKDGWTVHLEESEGTFTAAADGIHGQLAGFVEYQVTGGDLDLDGAEYQDDDTLEVQADCKREREGVESPTGWALQYFTDGAKAKTTSWSYTYTQLCYGKPFDTFAEPADGTAGPDTFEPCHPEKVTPEAPTVTQATCDGDSLVSAVLTIPDTEGVRYKLNSRPVDAGDVEVDAGTYWVKAKPRDGYVFPDGAQAKWKLDVDKAPTCKPTDEPTKDPTEDPTEEPTEDPTHEPTKEPTPEPTDEPTGEPTDEPTPTPEPTDDGDEDLPDTGAGSAALIALGAFGVLAGAAAIIARRVAVARLR